MKSLNEDEDAEDFDPVREGLIIKAVDKFLEEDADEVSDGEEGPRIFSQDYEARKKKMLQTFILFYPLTHLIPIQHN